MELTRRSDTNRGLLFFNLSFETTARTSGQMGRGL